MGKEELLKNNLNLSNDDYLFLIEKINGGEKDCIKKFLLGKYKVLGSKNFILNYLNKFDTSLNKLLALGDLFVLLNIELNISDIEDLINKNKLLFSVICEVIKENESSIISGSFYDKYDNFILEDLIDVYCDINKLNILNNYEIDDKDLLKIDGDKRFFQEIKKYKVLSINETRELIKKSQDGDKAAKDKLIEHNLRLVLKCAFRYKGRIHDFTVTDLFGEGVFGLIYAIDNFDLAKNTSFTTYAYFWIRQKIQRAMVNSGYSIRIPVHLREKQIKYYRAYKTLKDEYERDPTNLEIKNFLGCSDATIKRILAIPTADQSLNKRASDERDANEIGDLIGVDETAYENVLDDMVNSEISEFLFNGDLLNEIEKNVIFKRCGFLDGNVQTLQEIGDSLGVSRERVRQIEERAKRKLRHNRTFKSLCGLFDDNNNFGLVKKPAKPIRKTQEEKKEGIMMIRKKLNNLYEYFSDYTEQEIDQVIESLPDKYKQLLCKRYGNDLKNPLSNKLDRQDFQVFYYVVRTVIPKSLKCINQENKNKLDESLNNNPVNNEENLVNNTEVISDVYHSKILEIFEMPEFIELTKTMPIKTAIIVSLRLGYVDGKCFSSKNISDFLSISLEEVIEISKSGILILKNKLNNMIDEEIDRTDNLLEVTNEKKTR